jgi:hypothetical protein
MFPDPSTTRIIHDAMIKEEIERQNPEHLFHVRPGIALGRPRSAIRRRAALALVRLADRIAPAPRCTPEPRTA